MIFAQRLQSIGMHVSRYGLVLILMWIGGMKFTAIEAEGITPLVTHSPLLSWAYNYLSIASFAQLLGIVELFWRS